MKTESDLAASMAALLNPESVKRASATANAKEALVALSKTAEVMDNIELYSGSEAVTQVMEQISNKLK